MATQLVLQIILVLACIQQACAQISSFAKPGCQGKCGNVNIPYPFGIGTNCSADRRFEISCNATFQEKPFLVYDELEVLNISVLESTVHVNNPVLKDCTNETKVQKVIYLSTPYTFSATKNRFTAMGCDNLALMTQNGSNLGGCMSFCNGTRRDKICIGINCCKTRMPPSLRYFSTSLRSIDYKNGQEICRYAFIADWNWLLNLDDIYTVENMEQVPAVLNWKLYGECSGNTSKLCGKNSLCTNNQTSTNQIMCSCIGGYEGNPYLPDGCQGNLLVYVQRLFISCR